MKHLVTVLILFSSYLCVAQKLNVDSLLLQIDNKQIGIVPQYVWYPKMTSESGTLLVNIGKPATDKLLPLLSDSNKGIIAHFILSKIWERERLTAGHSMLMSVVPNDNDPTKLLVNYCGLTFHSNDSNWMVIADKAELERNKRGWEQFIKKISSR